MRLALLFHTQTHHHKREREMSMAVGMVFLLWSKNVFTKAVGLGNSSCSGAAAVCGNVTIPYPFGIEPGCYIDNWFTIGCNKTSEKPFLRSLGLEVLDISSEGTLCVNYPMSRKCPKGRRAKNNVSLASSPFVFSKLRNIFIAMGCDNLAYLLSNDSSNSSLTIGGCMSVCVNNTIQTHGSSCNGIDCCKTPIPSDLYVFSTKIQLMKGAPFESNEDCKYTSLVDKKWFEKHLTNLFEVRNMSHVPVVLKWEINANLSSIVMESNSSHSTCQFANGSSSLGNLSSTFTCSCHPGFEGNPYLVDGCHGKLLAPY